VVTKLVAKIERRIERLEERVRRVEKELELGGTIISFDWKDFSIRDKQILEALLRKGREGATTTELANTIGLNSPEAGGRTIVYTRLRRIERISKRLKGVSIIVMDRKRWFLNFDEFNFPEIKKSGEELLGNES